MAKIPRDSNLFNNIVKCLRKVTRVDFVDKYGRTDPIQRFVNKTTDEMTQDICFLMDEVTSNLDTMYSEIKHIFNYYNAEMEKIASKFHEKNLCQSDAEKLQVELVKSVTDLNIKAESLKSDLQAQQSEFQRYIHDYILTLREKSERNFQILNKLKAKQHNVPNQENNNSIKDMIENYSKSNPLQFTSTSMSTSGSISPSIDSAIATTSSNQGYRNKTKMDLENTSKNLEEICKKLKLTSKNLEDKKSDKNVQSSSKSESGQSGPKKQLKSLNNNLDNEGKKTNKVVLSISNNLDSEKLDEKLSVSDEVVKSKADNEKSGIKISDKKVTSFKISDTLMPANKDGIQTFNENPKILDEMKNSSQKPYDNNNRSIKENVTSMKIPEKLKNQVDETNNVKQKNLTNEIPKPERTENIPNKIEKKLNNLNMFLSQTQSLDTDNNKDEKIISRTSSLGHDPNDKSILLESQKQPLHQYTKNKKQNRFEYQDKLTKKPTRFSIQDSDVNRKIKNEWNMQSTTNTSENIPATCTPPPPPPCCIPPPPPPPCCIPSQCTCCSSEPDFCNDPCEKDESHGSVKYDLFEAYLCSKPRATRYMDYLDSVKKGLKIQNPSEGVCNKYIMSHTEFLEAIDTRKKLLRSIEKHRELENESLEPSTLAKLKAIVTCKLGRLKPCTAVTKSTTPQQYVYPNSKSTNKEQYALTEPQTQKKQYNYPIGQDITPISGFYPVIQPVESLKHAVQKTLTTGEQQYTDTKIEANNVQSAPSTAASTAIDTLQLPLAQEQTAASVPQPLSGDIQVSQKSYSYPKTIDSTPHTYTETQPTTDWQKQDYTKIQPAIETQQTSYAEIQPIADRDQLLYPNTQPAIEEAQNTYTTDQSQGRQEQYTYPETQPARQQQYSHSETQYEERPNQHMYSDYKSSGHKTAIIEESTNSEHAAQQNKHVYTEKQPITKEEKHSYSEAQPAAKQETRTHSEAQSAGKQNVHPYSETQLRAKQEAQPSSTEAQCNTTQGPYSYPHTESTSKTQQYSYSESEPAAKQEQNAQEQIAYQETQPAANQNPYAYPAPKSAAMQEQYTYPKAQHPATQEQYTYPKAQHPATQEQYTYPKAQHPATQEQYTYPIAQHSATQEQYNYSVSQPPAKKEQHTYPEAQSPAQQEQSSQIQGQPAAKQDQYTNSVTQSITNSEQSTPLEPQPTTNQDKQHTYQHTYPSTYSTAQDSYVYLEAEPKTTQYQPTMQQFHTDENFMYPTAPPYHQPTEQEKLIYPEMRPFEPKPSSMRQHIEQKIAEATKSKIEPPPQGLLPIKSIHIKENLPIRKSENHSIETNNNSNFTSQTQHNPHDEYTSKTTSLLPPRTKNIRFKSIQPNLEQNSNLKLKVKRKPLKITPTKRP